MSEFIYNFWLGITEYGLVHFITQLIAFAALIVAFCSNHYTQKKYLESRKPYLSMHLDDRNGLSVLTVKNTGGMPAKDIFIDIKTIGTDGIINKKFLEIMFQGNFDLYPSEAITGMVASTFAYGEKIKDKASIHVVVSYKIDGYRKKVIYARDIPFSKNFEAEAQNKHLRYSEIISDKVRDLSNIHYRIANYLDGLREFTEEDENDPRYRMLRKDLHIALKRVFGDKSTELFEKDDELPI